MKIRNGLIATAAAIALSSTAGAAFAGGVVSTTAAASVTILSPVTITKTQDLVFGAVIRPLNASPNTVSMDANDTVTISGAGNGSLVSSTTSSAKFNLVGPAAEVYTTGQTLTFTQTGLTGITASGPTATTGVLGTIPASGTQELRYGGSFNMSAATTAQAYTGTLTVTINYN